MTTIFPASEELRYSYAVASGKVNENLLTDGETPPLEVAGAAMDEYVKGLGDEPMVHLASILRDEDADGNARVAAGKAILEWVRPKKGMVVAINNSPTTQIVSHLGLPAPFRNDTSEAELYSAIEIPPAPPVAKVLPEPSSPMRQARLTAREEIEIRPAPEPPKLPDRQPEEPKPVEQPERLRKF